MRINCGPCHVRPWQEGDQDSLVRVANNRNIWRNLTHRFPHPYSRATADDWLALVAGAPPNAEWAIEIDGQAVGGVGSVLGEGVFAKSAHFGYWLGEPYWGRGIMTAAVGVVAERTMAHFDLVRLCAPVFAWNPASMRVLEKCGFVREGVLRKAVFKDGELIDEVLYARVRSPAAGGPV